MESSSPRTALMGVPSGAVIDSGTPKNARKYRLAVSSSMRRVTGGSLPRTTDMRHRGRMTDRPRRIASMISHAYADRMHQARAAAADAGLDAMFVTPGPGLRYLTGYDARV